MRIVSPRSLALVGILVALACSSGPAPEAVGGSAAALSGPTEALKVLQSSLLQSSAAALAQLSTKEQPDVVDGLAWYGDDARTLTVDTGWRGQVTKVGARFLSYDVAPSLPVGATQARADAAFAKGGVAYELLGLSTNESLLFVRSFAQKNGGRRFVYREQWKGVNVYGAVAIVDLDAKGKLTEFAATTVPKLSPGSGTLISSATALATAQSSLVSLGPPWKGATISALETEDVVVAQKVLGGPDLDRRAWRFLLVGVGRTGAVREVLVDRVTNTVLSSEDQVRYFDVQVVPAAGSIGVDAGNGTTILTQACDGTASFLTGSTPVERDADEASEAACEAQARLAVIGADSGHPSSDEWLGQSHRIGIGATPFLSIGINDLHGNITLAAGNGRLESIGHELFHSVLRSSSVTAFSQASEAEGGAVEESLCDAFGMLLERRFTHRRENDCMLADDADTLAAIGAQDVSSLRDDTTSIVFPYRPCADAGLARPWRSTCQPTSDNSGWCEGTSSYRNLAYSKYDAYGRSGMRSSTFVASHTNLGIGNRFMTSLLGAVAATPYTVEPVAEDDVARLVQGTVTVLPPRTDWAAYADALVRTARAIGGGPGISALERQVRIALVNGQLWSSPSVVIPAVGSSPTMLNPSPDYALGMAQLDLTGSSAGRQRTFVFFRDAVTPATIQYVWRDDVAGGAAATLGAGWVGPCSIAGTSAVTGLSAASSPDAIFLAYTESTSTPGVQRLRGRSLTGEAATTVTSGCGHAFLNNDPPVERLVQGTPSIAMWSASQYLTICDLLTQIGGHHYPFRTIGAMGLSIGDCVDIGERVPIPPPSKLVPKIGDQILGILKGLVDAPPAISIPQPGDPWGPRLPKGTPDLAATIPLGPIVRGQSQAAKDLGALPAPLGPRFADAFTRYGLARSSSVDMILRQNLLGRTADGFPQGTIQTIDYRFSENVLVVAFRDPSGQLRAATWDSTAATSDLAVLHPSPTTDAVLAQASVRVPDGSTHVLRVNFLYAVYGTASAGAPRVSYSVARSFDPLSDVTSSTFDAPLPLTDFVGTAGLRRQIDMRFLRTASTPAATGGMDALHVATIGLAQPEVPSDSTVTPLAATTEDRIRWAVFRPGTDGKLSPASERPVRLRGTALAAGATGTAGTFLPATERGRIWWAYPRGASGLSLRSQADF